MMLFRQFLMEIKLSYRDREATFWNFAFPLLLLVGLGLVFHSERTPRITVVAAGAAARSPGDTAQLEVRDGALVLKVNGDDAAQAQLAAALIQQANPVHEVRGNGNPEPRWLAVSRESPDRRRHLSYVAFLVPGLLGMNLLNMGLTSTGLLNIDYRKRGHFRRYSVTPLPKLVFLAGQICHRLTETFLQTALLLTLAHFAFGVANHGSYLLLALLLVLGTACFMAMGLALSGFAETPEGFVGLGNWLYLPMVLLSGMYFTLDSAPAWLQRAAAWLPLSPYLETLRAVFNDGHGLAGHGRSLAMVVAWTVACLLVALKRFRWA